MFTSLRVYFITTGTVRNTGNKKKKKPAKTTKANFQSNIVIWDNRNKIDISNKLEISKTWGLQLHREQYYIKGVNRIGAFGINHFTEYGQTKKRKTKKEGNRQKLQKQFFKNNIVIWDSRKGIRYIEQLEVSKTCFLPLHSEQFYIKRCEP